MKLTAKSTVKILGIFKIQSNELPIPDINFEEVAQSIGRVRMYHIC